MSRNVRLEGIESGERWARARADPRQAKNLAHAMYYEEPDIWFAGFTPFEAFEASQRLAEAIVGESLSGAEVYGFWLDEVMEPRGVDDLEFVVGFAEGAMDVWDYSPAGLLERIERAKKLGL